MESPAYPVEHVWTSDGKQEEGSEPGQGLDLIQSTVGSLRDQDSNNGK